ncbi:MAG: MoaD/ThiS family protein [Synergistetes bacterium]|nr:MoaD/ThiS family protein [Synergistota bacterium]MDW8192870.1 MoaD/ThiS family protein [Synergistota bacterium]
MAIRVLSFVYDEAKAFELEDSTPLRVKDILLRLSIPLDLFGIAISKGKVLMLDDEVSPGSEVRIIPPVGGG